MIGLSGEVESLTLVSLVGAAGLGAAAEGCVGAAFLTVRIALVGAVGGFGAAAPFPPLESSWRMRPASSSLIELL